MRDTLLSLVIIAFGSTHLAGCDEQRPTFVEGKLPAAVAGEPFEHQFEVTNPWDDGSFSSCSGKSDSSNKWKVSPQGKATFTPGESGEVELCVRYGARDRIAVVHKLKLDVQPAAADRPEAQLARLEVFRKKLAAVRDASRAVKRPKSAACPKDMLGGRAHAYDAAYLDIVVDKSHLTTKTRRTGAFDPPFAAMWEASSATVSSPQLLKDRVDKMTKPKFLLVARADKLTSPVVKSVKEFVPGVFKGHVQVFEIDNAKLWCTFPLAFESGESVKFVEVGFDPSAAGAAVRKDFGKSGRVALKKALKKHASPVDYSR